MRAKLTYQRVVFLTLAIVFALGATAGGAAAAEAVGEIQVPGTG